MARAHRCDLRAVLAGAVICWAAAEGIAVAQEAAEVTEELGNSYLLARRTTDQGSIIETVLYDGQAIVTDIAVPTSDTGMTAGTTGAVAPTADGGGNALPGGAAALPPGFGGTWLTGEIIDDYLVLHRIRASAPVTHEIFRQGQKVGSITEAPPSGRDGRLAGRNSFAFESTDGRFVVHLTQPDGTRIHATTEHGRFLGQTVERSAALLAPPRSGVGIAAPLQPRPGALGPSVGRSVEPQRLARPQEAPGSIMVEEPRPQVIRKPPDTAPLPRSSPLPRTKPAVGAAAVHPASPSPTRNQDSSAPETAITAPTVRLRPAATSANAPPPAPATSRPAAPASAATAPAARPRPTVAAVSTRPPAAAAAKPTAPASAAAKRKPAPATENGHQSPRAAEKPVTPATRYLPSPPDL